MHLKNNECKFVIDARCKSCGRKDIHVQRLESGDAYNLHCKSCDFSFVGTRREVEKKAPWLVEFDNLDFSYSNMSSQRYKNILQYLKTCCLISVREADAKKLFFWETKSKVRLRLKIRRWTEELKRRKLKQNLVMQTLFDNEGVIQQVDRASSNAEDKNGQDV